MPTDRLIACLGDSITQTAVGRSYIDFPLRVEQILGPGNATANLGVGGNTIGQMGSRYISQINEQGYNCLVLLGGVNDLIAGTSADTIWETMEQVAMVAQMSLDCCVLITVLPFRGYTGWNADKQVQLELLNGYIRASEFGPVVDAYAELGNPENPDRLLPAYAAFEDGSATDWLHIGNQGVERLAQLVATALGES